MVSWNSDGGVSGYNVFTGQLDTSVIKLASSGTVDVEGITRLQYTLPVGNDRLGAQARLHITPGDIARIDTGPLNGQYGHIGVTMFIAASDNYYLREDRVPTPVQIRESVARQGQGLSYRSNESLSRTSSSGDYIFYIQGPRARLLEPNTKYWVLLLPSIFFPGTNTATEYNDTPLDPAGANTNGRAVSIWTNRAPLAPVITSPNPGTVVASGADVTFSFTPNDPDAIVGVSKSYSNTDLAGMQIQYAPRATAAKPNPTWTDLPFTDTVAGGFDSVPGGKLGLGWYIYGSNSFVRGENNGALNLLQTQTALIRCGSNVLAANRGVLPSGNWQIRIRVFDWGHPEPTRNNPFVKNDGNYTPGTAPAFNTSPWSKAIIISVAAQVPPPVPTSPANDNAVPEGRPLTLVWRYLNTHQPPYAQAGRTVQMRKVGQTDWTTLVSENSDSAAYQVTGYTMAANSQYEWQVQVTDSAGAVSNYSEAARFWVVPAPASGDVRALPSGTLDGATLGCGTHRVYVYQRGGKVRVGEVTQLSYVDWERMRDDISTARVAVSGWALDCGNLLAKLQCWAYELVIYRDNGYSVERVWEGPITLLKYEVDKVTISAKDVMAYAYRRIIKQEMNDGGKGNGDTVTSRATRVLQNVFAPDDPNVLAYMNVTSLSDDAKEYRSLPAFSRTAYEEVDDMAANAGLDYTTVGRSILLWGTKHRIGTLPEFRDEDLGAPPIVSEYGMSFANFYSVSDGNGIHGDASRLDEFGEDPTYGLVEMLSSTWASDSEEEEGTYTQEGIATIIKSFEGYAERSIADRYPPPVVVRIPDNTTLNPGTVLSIQELVPGVAVPLRSTGTLRPVVGTQKLDSVKVVEEGGAETISITLSAFSRDDANAGEEEAEE